MWIFLKTSSPSLFCGFLHEIPSKDPINPRDELSSPLSGALISACDEGERVSCFYPDGDRRDLVDLVPGELAVIAFSVEIIGQDTAGAGVSMEERRPGMSWEHNTITC